MVAPNTLSPDDFRLKGQIGKRGMRTLINLHEIASMDGPYRYLEVGSYLGKSLQPHVMDDDCLSALSIDLRPDLTPDERGPLTDYQHITTQHMLDGLRQYASDRQMQKLTTRETGSDSLRSDPPDTRFDLAFIDAEHTIEAAFADFLNVITVMNDPCIVAFDDTHIVYPAVRNAATYLAHVGTEHTVVHGGGGITAIFIGADAGDRAVLVTPENRVTRETIAANYDEVLAKSHIKRSMTRFLRKQPDLQRKAARCLRNRGYQVTAPEEG